MVCGRQEQERFLNALFLIYGSHMPIPRDWKRKYKADAYGLFYGRLKKKFILFHLSCPCVRQSPRILYEGFNLSASSAGVSP